MTQELSQKILSRPGHPGVSLRCLIIDDEADIRSTLGLCLETLGHQAIEADGADEAVRRLMEAPVDIAFVDVRLGTSSGLDLITQLLALSPGLKILVITAYASVAVAIQAMTRGAADLLCKPFTPDQVGDAVARMAELRTLEHNVGALQDRTGTAGPEADFATASAAVQQAVTTARQAAASPTPILIRGENGTGMRVLARAIHGWSNRQHKLCRVLLCSQNSPAYVDLALFGETVVGDKPVLADRPSLLDECEGGTLVIAHVEALSARSQAKLLRVVEKNEYELPGSSHTRACDVRIVATTAPATDPPSASELLTSIGRVTIELPPLRQRVDDIPMLAQRYLAYLRQKSGKTVLGFGTEALDILKAYAWPRNLHELREVAAEAVLSCNGLYVQPTDLPAAVCNSPLVALRQRRLGDPVPLRIIEQEHIRAVLASAKSLQEACKILDMDYQKLYRRRKQFGIL